MYVTWVGDWAVLEAMESACDLRFGVLPVDDDDAALERLSFEHWRFRRRRLGRSGGRSRLFPSPPSPWSSVTTPAWM